MTPSDVIDTYVLDVIRRLPGRDREGIGLELRGLLTDMLAERAEASGRAADDAMVLAMLRAFGTPAEVATRYRPPGVALIPADETRSYVLWAVGGVILQWALTLPQVFGGELRFSAWWFSGGLGALWWPGFMLMAAIVKAGLRQLGWRERAWRPKVVDAERVERGLMLTGLIWAAIGTLFMMALPWMVPHLPGVLPGVLAFDPAFLTDRAWLAVPLWIAGLVGTTFVYVRGRWSTMSRRAELILDLAWIALLGWWIIDGRMFIAPLTNEGARGALGLVVLILVAHVAVRLWRQRTRIRLPDAIGSAN